jgi:hypothetical protein
MHWLWLKNMKISRIITMLAMTLLIGCENWKRSSAVGSEDINVTGAEHAFYAFENDKVKFVVLPTFDWTRGRSEVDTASGNMGGRGSWTGNFEYGDGRSWSYEVSGKSARFGGRQLTLEDGEIFVLSPDLSVRQLRGKKAGDRHGENFEADLARLLNTRPSEAGERQPTIAPDSQSLWPSS